MDNKSLTSNRQEWGMQQGEMQNQALREQEGSRKTSTQKSEVDRGSHISRSASKLRYNQSSANLEELVGERKAVLSRIFQFYSSFGERTNLRNLRSNKFHKMMQDCGIPLSKTTLDLMFVSQNHHK